MVKMTTNTINNIIIVILTATIVIVLYYRYKIKEGFQDATPIITDLSANALITKTPLVDLNNIPVINVPSTTITTVTSADQIQKEIQKVVGPIIAATPEIQDTDLPNISNINSNKLTQQIQAMPAIDSTAIDRRHYTDTGRQCDTAQTQLVSLQNNLQKYKNMNSWAQVRTMSSSITSLQNHMSDLGC